MHFGYPFVNDQVDAIQEINMYSCDSRILKREVSPMALLMTWIIRQNQNLVGKLEPSYVSPRQSII